MGFVTKSRCKQMDQRILKNAFSKAIELDYTNGMATKSVDIKTDMGDISIIRKCGNTVFPELFLVKIKENEDMGHISPNTKGIAKEIRNLTCLENMDVNIIFKSHDQYNDEYSYACLIPVSIFNL